MSLSLIGYVTDRGRAGMMPLGFRSSCFVWHASRAAGVVALPMLSPVITLGVGKSPRAPGGQRRLLFLAARMI
jgi:hypothetical protein